MSVNIVDIRKYPTIVLSVNDEAEVLNVPFAELERTLEGLVLHQSGEMIAFADAGLRPWWHRLLGVTRYVQTCFQLRWQGDWAALAFADRNNAECVAVSEISSDADKRAHSDLPLQKGVAIRALCDYFRTGTAPLYLSYEVAR